MEDDRLAIALVLLLAGRGFAAPCGVLHDPSELGIDLSTQETCDPLVPERCLLPLPNDYFTIADYRDQDRPARHVLARCAPAERRRQSDRSGGAESFDGFSPGSALLMWFPAADLALSDTPTLTNLGRSLEADSPS
jgi:hypothetical protein